MASGSDGSTESDSSLFDVILTKPISFHDLVNAIQRLLSLMIFLIQDKRHQQSIDNILESFSFFLSSLAKLIMRRSDVDTQS